METRGSAATPSRCLLVLVLFPLTLLQCSPRPEQRVFAGETQGTTYTIKVVADKVSPERRAAIGQAIEARLGTIDKQMSLYRPDSEISLFNAREDTEPLEVSDDLAAVFQLAHNVSAASGGAFDVTVKPLVDAWGFGPSHQQDEPPTDPELASLHECIGYEKVHVDRAAHTLRKTLPSIRCDLNAIAQGYTVDKLAEDINRLGHVNYMVEVGGEVKARGLNALNVPWRIGIEKPSAGRGALQRIIALDDKALATSGDYRQYYERDGVRISHTIDPRTGRPVTHSLASASVIHESCALADAFATALMVLGPDEGYEFAIAEGLAALLVIHESADQFREKTTPAFEERCEARPPE